MSDADFERFRSLVAEILEQDAAAVTPESRFVEDLDADSLAVTELVMAMEEEFEVTLDDSRLAESTTVAKAWALVSEARN